MSHRCVSGDVHEADNDCIRRCNVDERVLFVSLSSQGMEHVDLEQEYNNPRRSPASAVRLKRGEWIPPRRHVTQQGKSFSNMVLEKLGFPLDKGASLGASIGQKDGARPKRLIGLHNDRR